MKTFDNPNLVTNGLMRVDSVEVEVAVTVRFKRRSKTGNTPMASMESVQRYVSIEDYQDGRALHGHELMLELATSVLTDALAPEE